MPVVFEDSGCIIPRNQLLAASISRQQTQRKLTGLKLSRDREITFNKTLSTRMQYSIVQEKPM